MIRKRFSLVILLGTIAAPLTAQQACSDPQYREFDFWIGEWDLNNRYRVNDQVGWRDIGSATNHVFPVAGGCAIVELWDGYLGPNHIRGFSVRAWDYVDEEWKLVLSWPQQNRPSFGMLSGRFRHGRGDFFSESRNADGGLVMTRYSFADITPTSLRWNDGTSLDSGRTWATRWIMEFQRRNPMDPPIYNVTVNAPGERPLCEGEEFRRYDFLHGEWLGVDSVSAVQGFYMRTVPINDGCGAMDFVSMTVGDQDVEAFAARAYSAPSQRWVQYSIDTRNPRFRRMEGDSATELVLAEVSEAEERQRMSFEPPENGQVLVVFEVTEDGGGTWTGAGQVLMRRLH